MILLKTIIVVLSLYVVLGLAVKIILMIYYLVQNKKLFQHIVFKLPRDKTYLEKKSPIYKLEPFNKTYKIRKYEQGWVESELFTTIATVLLLVFVNVLKWRYVKDSESVILPSHINNTNIHLYTDFNIAEYYEERIAKSWSDHRQYLKEKKIINNSISKINKEFTENYIN